MRNDKKFYVNYHLIKSELLRYEKEFTNKSVFCFCFDEKDLNFIKFFAMNFDRLNLKKLVALTKGNLTDGQGYKIEVLSKVKCDENTTFLELIQVINADVRNKVLLQDKEVGFFTKECQTLIENSDIVILNPPQKIFKPCLLTLTSSRKKYLIIGDEKAFLHKEVFELFKTSQTRTGYTKICEKNFSTHKKSPAGTGFYFTNLYVDNKEKAVIPYVNYSKTEYLNFENFDGIDVFSVELIPKDYDGFMCVPLDFLDVFDPERFLLISHCDCQALLQKAQKKLQVLDKFGNATKVFVYDGDGVLYRKYNPKFDKTPPCFKDCDTGVLYTKVYPKIIIKKI